MAEYHRVIGIDLGTTFSVVAAYSFDKKDVKVIPNRQNEPTTPSVVYVAPDGRVSVGKAAKEKLARDPNRVIFEVKRLMGEQAGRPQGDGPCGRASSSIPRSSPRTSSRSSRRAAERVIGEPIHDAVITVPARFKEPQKNATREAAKIAKLNPRLIINEPTAAAVAYGLDSGEPQTFVVFDFGGGTFDVSVVRIMEDQTVEILGTGGDPHLGAATSTRRSCDWALGQDESPVRPGLPRATLAWSAGSGSRPSRSRSTSATSDSGRTSSWSSRRRRSTRSTTASRRPISTAMLQPLLDRAMAEVDVALASARAPHDLTLDDVDAFILVGGSSRIPAGRAGPPRAVQEADQVEPQPRRDRRDGRRADGAQLRPEPGVGRARRRASCRSTPKAAGPPEEIVRHQHQGRRQPHAGHRAEGRRVRPADPQGPRHPAQGRPRRVHHRAGQPDEHLRARLPGGQPQGEPELPARRRGDRRARRGPEGGAPVPGHLRARRRRHLRRRAAPPADRDRSRRSS